MVTLNNVDIIIEKNSGSDLPASINIRYGNITKGSFLKHSSNRGYGTYQLTDSVIHSWDGYQNVWYLTSDVLIAKNTLKDIGKFSVGTNNSIFTFENNLFYDLTNLANGKVSGASVIEN